MKVAVGSSSVTVAVAWMLVTMSLVQLAAAAKEKRREPQCIGSDRVCNAVIHFPDKVIDQGRYCNGCLNCSGAVELNAVNSFFWQHFEHPRMRVQFLKCGEYVADRTCGPRDVKAAVFVSPRNSWEPALEQMYCRCPVTDWEIKVPIYHLINWHLESDLWIYEFGCKAVPCSVASPILVQKERLVGSVCARKRRQSPESPIDVNFVCACPPDFHCYVSEQDVSRPSEQTSGSGADTGSGASGASETSETTSGGSGSGGGGGSPSGSGGGEDGGGGELVVADMDIWRQVLDEATGSYVYEKRQRCEKRLANQTGSEHY